MEAQIEALKWLPRPGSNVITLDISSYKLQKIFIKAAKADAAQEGHLGMGAKPWFQTLREEMEEQNAIVWIYHPWVTQNFKAANERVTKLLGEDRVFPVVGPQKLWLLMGILINLQGKSVIFSDEKQFVSRNVLETWWSI